MPEVAVRELTMAEAVREALSEEMRRDPSVFILGEDVAEAGTPFKVLSGMVEEFGKSRVIDTPISEPGFTGIGVGAAMTGLRPVVDIMFGDFLTLVMDRGCESRPPKCITCLEARGKCRWCCAPRWELRAALLRNTRNRCRPGSATFPA